MSGKDTKNNVASPEEKKEKKEISVNPFESGVVVEKAPPVKNNPTLEGLTGEASEEEKTDRKAVLKKFLEDHKNEAKKE